MKPLKRIGLDMLVVLVGIKFISSLPNQDKGVPHSDFIVLESKKCLSII